MLFSPKIEAFFVQYGVGAGIRRIPLRGGRNNRVFRVEAGDLVWLVKQYRRDRDWSRLAAESRFLAFCAGQGVTRVPRLLGEDENAGFAIHSWVEGKRLPSILPTASDCSEAAAFAGELFAASRRPGALVGTAPARDSCFCLNDYFRSPRERVNELERFLANAPPSTLYSDAYRFVRENLRPTLEKIVAEAVAGMGGMGLHAPFPKDILIYSPSDFGFHNTLRTQSGMVFVDFEYAGLDDPAKLIADFLCQADYAVSEDVGEVFAAACEGASGIMERVRLVLPLVKVKFACIVLNPFRDDASLAERADADRLREQLAKAKRICDGLC